MNTPNRPTTTRSQRQRDAAQDPNVQRDGKRSPERLYRNRETRSRCGRGPTGDPTCRPSKIQALPYQILHEMKPIASTNPSPEAQISQLERIKWSVYGSDGDRQAARPRHKRQIRIVIPQTARAAHRTDPSIPASSRQSVDPSSRVFTPTGPAVT